MQDGTLNLANPKIIDAKYVRYNFVAGLYICDLILGADIEGVYKEMRGQIFLTDCFNILCFTEEIRDTLRTVKPSCKYDLVVMCIERCKALIENGSDKFAF